MNKIFELRFGSNLYGTNGPNSDLDIKSIYIPTAREIVLGNYKKTINTSRPKAICERNNKDDIDLEVVSLCRYLELLTEGQTMALDMLFAAPHIMHTYINPKLWHIWQHIYVNKEKLLSKDVTAFIGYSRTQAAKYGIKGSRMEALKQTLDLLNTFHIHTRLGDYEPHIIKLVEDNVKVVSFEKEPLIQIVQLLGANKVNLVPHLQVCNRKLPFGADIKFCKMVLQKIFDEYGSRAHKAHLDGGKDYKALSHAVRVNSEGLELLETGHITFPRPDAELLKKIKNKELPFEEIGEIIEQGLVDLVEAQKNSKLRDKPDLEWRDQFLFEVYSEVVKNEYKT